MTFEENWPEISRMLTRLLGARHVPECHRDDIIQETGVRLLRAWPRIDPDQGAWGLARTIAIHAIADGASRHSRYELTDLADLPEPSDPELAGIARFHLSTVRRALSQMSPTDQRVLLAEVGAAVAPRLGRSAMKMARSRARQRLRVLVEKQGAWGVFPHVPLRVRVEHARRFLHERAVTYQQVAEGAMTAVVALAVAVTTLNAGPDMGSPRVPDTQSGVRALGAAMTGVELPQSRLAHRAPDASEIPTGAPPRRVDTNVDAASTEPWWKNPIYARETAEGVGQDAAQLQKDAEQAEKDAQQIGEDAKEVGEEGKQLADELRP